MAFVLAAEADLVVHYFDNDFVVGFDWGCRFELDWIGAAGFGTGGLLV